MKINHLQFFLLVFVLHLIWSVANESTSGENAGDHQSPVLSLGRQLQGLNASVKPSNGESMRRDGEDLDPLRRRSHSRKGGSGAKGGGRSAGGGSQSVRGPHSERSSDSPCMLLLNSTLTQIIFHALLVTVFVV